MKESKSKKGWVGLGAIGLFFLGKMKWLFALLKLAKVGSLISIFVSFYIRSRGVAYGWLKYVPLSINFSQVAKNEQNVSSAICSIQPLKLQRFLIATKVGTFSSNHRLFETFRLSGPFLPM